MNPEEKRQTVADLHARMERAKVAILTRFVGINVEKMTQLRRELRKSAVEYRIVKNTLLRLALKGTDKEKLGEKLEGPIAVASSEVDLVTPARVLAKFSKEFPEVQILMASSEGKLWGPADIQNWVNLPSLDVLRSKILGFIKAPSAGLARLMATPGTQLAQLLQARSEQE